MALRDREWFNDSKHQRAPWKPRRARPVFFVHYLAGFWPGFIAGLAVGLIAATLVAAFWR